jgi:adenine/guanine/hypoxanthine permease
MTTKTQSRFVDLKNRNFKVEFLAGLSTYMTLSYIFILNPVLLSKTGIDVSAAFFATVVSAAISTIIMGVWANLPFAVAPAPSITTFFVSYVCLKLGLSWQAALASAFLSGVLSILMTYFSVRSKLIEAIPPPLRVGVLFALGGFLIANGLSQAKVIFYTDGWMDFGKINFKTSNIYPLVVGLLVTLGLKNKKLNFPGAPVIGIVAAFAVCFLLNIKSNSKASLSSDMFLAVGKMDFSFLRNPDFLLTILIFFIIDFFGGVGKYVGLFEAMDEKEKIVSEDKMGKALYVDGIGNLIGGFLGASSLAVFVSSAVGIKAGGKTGKTALVAAGLMLLSLFLIPLVGAIPVEATTGVLIYVGLILMPTRTVFRKTKLFSFDSLVSVLAFLISFLTFGIDKAIMLVFFAYSGQLAIKGHVNRNNWILITTTLFLVLAFIIQLVI